MTIQDNMIVMYACSPWCKYVRVYVYNTAMYARVSNPSVRQCEWKTGSVMPVDSNSFGTAPC